jgi:hypothetical protein
MFRFLFPCVCCVEGVATTSVQVAFRLSFYLGLRPFLTVDYFSSAVREEWQLPLFTAFKLPFCLWLRLFLFGESAAAHPFICRAKGCLQTGP